MSHRLKFAILTAAFLASSPLSSPSAAEKPDGAEEYQTHLEFAGYTVEVTDKRVTARHAAKYNFALYKLRGGVLAQAFITGKPKVKEDRPACLEMVNRVNARTSSVRAYIDKEGDVALEAWYQPPYDKNRFALFLDIFDEARPILIEEDKEVDCLK